MDLFLDPVYVGADTGTATGTATGTGIGAGDSVSADRTSNVRGRLRLSVCGFLFNTCCRLVFLLSAGGLAWPDVPAGLANRHNEGYRSNPGDERSGCERASRGKSATSNATKADDQWRAVDPRIFLLEVPGDVCRL